MTPFRRALRFTASLLALIIGAAPAAAQQADGADSTLRRALLANRHLLALEDGRLTGPGGELLITEGRAAQFTLIGEEHGVAEIPALTAALFRALVPAGYRHLAIETGDALAAALDSAARQPRPLESLTRFFEAHWPGAPFFALEQEARLLAEAVTASSARDVLWGLDYDIMADRYALARLEPLARTSTEQQAVARLRHVADSLLRRAMAERNPGLIMMFGGPMEPVQALRTAFSPPAGSPADRIINELEQTLRINQYWLSGQGYRSNEARANWNKRQFGRMLREATAADGAMPRVMLKFGGYHMMRGRTTTDVYDLGSLASELADASGARSFHLMVVAGAGTNVAVADPTVMEYRPAPAGVQREAWARPLFELADPAQWTLYDLRPLRPLLSAGRLGAIPERLARTIWAFDAYLVLSGSTPGTMLPVTRPW
jgi:hypothetical protein